MNRVGEQVAISTYEGYVIGSICLAMDYNDHLYLVPTSYIIF